MMRPVTDPIRAELKCHQLLAAGVLGILSGLVVFMAVGGWVLTYRQGFTVFSVLPLLFLPLAMMAAKHRQWTTTEIGARKP